MQFFYDHQTRRYLLQFMRIFSDIKIRNGPDANGLYTIQRVPIMYGDPSWMVSQLIKGASENTLLPSPMFSAWIENIKLAPDRRQDTQFVGKISTIERNFNPLTQQYNNQPGIRQDVERYMPVPYDLFFRLDVWTTNTTNKLQIMEQICTIFNPSIQLQQNSNLMDWTSIFEVWLEDIVWSNRSIPQGSEDTRDVLSFKFKVQAWINPPAKLKRSGVISEIVTNVFYSDDIQNIESKVEGSYDYFRDGIEATPVQIITTEGNYKVSVFKNNGIDEIMLLNKYGQEDPELSWEKLIKIYGQITPNITKMRLKLNPDIDVSDDDIIGDISQDPTRKNILLYTVDVDTLPSNSFAPILGIIDPMEVSPGDGLPLAYPGQRYILTSQDSIGEEPAIPPGVSTSPWGDTIVAYPNDIIEYNGTTWMVIFDSRNNVGKKYVMNNENGSQYVFENNQWSYTYYGIFDPGYWRIDNIMQISNSNDIDLC